MAIPILAGRETFPRKLRDSASSPMLRCGSLRNSGASSAPAGGLGAGASTSGFGRVGDGSSITGAAGARPAGTGGSAGFGLTGVEAGGLDTGAAGGGAGVALAPSWARAGDTGARAGVGLHFARGGAG